MKRNSHYWMWLLLAGIGSAGLTYAQEHALTLENGWLLFGGAMGVASGSAWLHGGKLSRSYDLIAGLLFGVSGAIGVLQGLGMQPLAGVHALSAFVTSTGVLGMSVGVYPAVIHTMLGYVSLSHGLKAG